MFRIMVWLYNLVLPLGFIGFLPGLIFKLINRPGWKSTFAERFGFFSAKRLSRWRNEQGGTWIHAVSVGETMIALSLIKKMLQANPAERIILSTTTTTGQELARQKAPDQVQVIFAPIDFYWTVNKFYRVLKVERLVIFETEIWPNMLGIAAKKGIPAFLVNARMSDHSCRGYYRFRCFFGPLLAEFKLIIAQSEADAERFHKVSPAAQVAVSGNLKFDQYIDPNLPAADFSGYFGPGKFKILIAASTHPGEEKLVIETYKQLLAKHPDLRLVVAPRHAERGGEVANLFKQADISFAQRSIMPDSPVPVMAVLADTTGELLKLMKAADVVIMGKSLAGQDEGHNLIEPALLGKAIVCGAVLRNFRFVLNVLTAADALALVSADSELLNVLDSLFLDENERKLLGDKAKAAISIHSGAIEKTLTIFKTVKKTRK